MLHNYFDVYPTCLSNMFFGMSFQFVAHMCRIFSFMNFVIITTSVWFETAILTLQKPHIFWKIIHNRGLILVV